MERTVRKRLISKRGDNSEDSDAEIIIDLSDEDSISISDTSSEEEIQTVVELEPAIVTHYWAEKPKKSARRYCELTRRKPDLENTTTSWADELCDVQSNTRKEYSKKEKRYPSNFNKRSTADDSTTARWTHDMYDEDSDDSRAFKQRPQKQRSSKKVHFY